MERYHILKLGLAITFYAAYCIRPMLVNSLEADNELDNNPSVSSPVLDYFQYFQGVEGRPGVDYPVYSYIPRTAFSCRGIESGYYADLDTNCQVFHICEDGKKISFLCPNGTIFQQSELICEWWNKVNCTNSPSLYEESAERLQNDVARRKASRKVAPLNGAETGHGAIVRTEERSSVRTSSNRKNHPVRPENQQRNKNHRIPDNNDIEHQIEEAESNNRHLANAQNSIATPQRNNVGNQQQKYLNHNYNNARIDLNKTNTNQSSKSKQTKKDIDKDTGNYINNNYDQYAPRQSKKVEQGPKNEFGFGSRTGQDKSSSPKDYYVQFGSTSTSTEKYSPVQKNFQSATQTLRQQASGFKPSEYPYSAPTTISTTSYQNNFNNERIAAATASPQVTYSNTGVVAGNKIATAAPSSNNNNVVSSSTLPPPLRKQTTTPAYGISLKDRYTSFDARPTTKQAASSQNNFRRGSIRYNSNSNYLNGQQTSGKDSSKYATPVTTYSPPTRYFASKAPPTNNGDDNFDLPPFPKHKSELTAENNEQNTLYNNRITPQPISSTFRSNIPGQIQVNVGVPSHESIKSQNSLSEAAIGFKSVAHNKNGNTNKNHESEESQVPQESSSFVKNTFNSITDESFKTTSSPYPNHRNTYSDIKDLSYLEAPKISSISSITPHLVTTQPINNGKPFVGSRVGSTVLPNQPTTQSKYTYLPTSTDSSKPTIIFGVLRHSSTTEPPPYGPPELFNTGSTPNRITDLFNTGLTNKALPPIETTTLTTKAVPTKIFNVGNTDTTLPGNSIPITTDSPLKIYVPEQGLFNVGQNEPANNNYEGVEPVNEPPFIKKTVPLLYSGHESTQRTVDHATIYGTYPVSTQKSFASTTNTPYSPTVPTVTQSSSARGYSGSSTPRTSKSFDQGVPIKFDRGQDKISVHLSKNVGGQTRTKSLPKYGSAVQPPLLKVGAVVHVGDVQPLGGSSTTIAPQPQPNGFFVTRGFNEQSFSTNPSKSKIEKPRPFSKSLDFGELFNTGKTKDDEQDTNTPTFPTYRISSARPFGISETTLPTPTFATEAPPSLDVYNNVDSMIGVLQEIANFNSQKEYAEDARPGLVIPPSVGPQTLHSLAQYFANELQINDTDSKSLKPETKEKLTSLLTAMTVHGYNNLFNVGATATPTAPTSTVAPETTTIPIPSRFGNANDNDVGGESGNSEENSTDDDGDLLSTTSLPELRQLARNFSLALSSYLNDPDNFRKSLEGFRPTEPPPLEGSDNAESSTSEDELLNFSDADVKPSTPAVPSATWGYVLAANKDTQDDVKNSLNPDLNTADSQSFVPRFNNVQVNEKPDKGFTELPPNHWTSSPQATRLWQKELSVNPAVVNDHFETTPSGIVLTEDETAEPELFNPDVLPDLTVPQSEFTYDLRELPPLSLNSTQVHGILIDFMNHTKSDEHNRLNRILKKLNTSEEEFLDRMKEIESNPLTKRLILLLISECGANITQDLGIANRNQEESLSASASAPTAAASTLQARSIENHPLGRLIHPHLNEEDEDTRALQLLNSLYSIASRFGKKR